MKISLGALSKNFVDIELDRRPFHEVDEIVYEYDKETISVIGIRFIIKSNF